MAGSPLNFDFDFNEFDRTLKQYAEVSEKDFADIANNKALELAGGFGNANPGALQLTHHADAAVVAQQLAARVETVERVSKSGKVTKRRKLHFGIGDKDLLSARIVNARRKRDGQPPLWGKALTEASRKLTGARIRSVNFIRSGWVASIRQLASVVGRVGGSGGVKADRPKGYAIAAKPGVSTSATIVNTALNPRHGGSNRAVGMAEAGLQEGVRRVTANMRTYIERKLQQTADRFNAR